MLRIHIVVHIFLLIVEDWPEVQPTIEPFILVFSFDQVEEVFLLKISKLNVASGLTEVHGLLGLADLLINYHLFIYV